LSTQARLLNHSLSPRVIQKAERNGNVRHSTIHALADVFELSFNDLVLPSYRIDSQDLNSKSERIRRLRASLSRLKMYTYAGLAEAIASCDKAMAAERFEEAWCTVALSHINLGKTAFCRVPCDQSLSRARKLLEDALRQDSRSASGHAIRGLIYMIDGYD
jgi:hypothetical protein